MGALKDKILSYNPEIYRPFTDTTISTSAAKFGTLTADTITLNAAAQITYVADGPAGESQDSWNFQKIAGQSDSRINFTNANTTAAFTDRDYTMGLWVKYPSLPTGSGTTTNVLFNVGTVSTTGSGFTVFVAGSGVGQGNASKIGIQTSNGTALTITYGPLFPNDANWHYIAVRRILTDIKVYLDGTEIISVTNPLTASAANPGIAGIAAFANVNHNLRVSHFHLASSSAINTTAILEIWQTGFGGAIDINYTNTAGANSSALMVDPSILTDVNYTNTTGATASALFDTPTITIGQPGNTEITPAAITGSAEFLPNFAVYASININITNTGTMNASTIFGDNVIIIAGSDASYSSEQLTASALMTDARTAESPFIASALMGNHSASVTPSYYGLVKSLNPYLYIFDGQSAASIVNHGYQSGTFVKGSNLLINQTSPFPLDMVAEGKSWRGASTYNSDGFITFETTNFANSFNNLIGTGNFAYEVWVNPQQFPDNSPGITDVDYAIIRSEKITLKLIEGLGSIENFTPRRIFLTITGTNQTLSVNLDSTPLTLQNWNHIVINVYQSGINANERLIQLWINGQVVINQNVTFTTFTDNTDKINIVLGSDAIQLTHLSDMYYDELAIYSAPLTNSQIIQHNNFIGTLSPNFFHNASTFTVDAISGDHQFVVTSNVNAIATPITGSANFVMPSILAVKQINYSAQIMTATAVNTDVTVYYGRTMVAIPAIASAFKPESYRLSNIYYNYIQSNITPYRYVSFDHTNPYLDFGTDTDYAVAPTVVGGDIVNPDLGINGKSAKTAGSSYVTDGVILKESEHDDNWGTGNNSWHSSFWMEQALDDTSTGLRVLWNLNGAYDNQNIILYHYQNKLHLQINNQVGAPITITSTNNISLFNLTRHHIVINSHHNNNNNHIYVYVDAVLVLDQNIGSYAVTTINNPIHVGANDEANNFARLGVGCLITPFGYTALPVVPTNTRLIIDEVYWDKDQILQTMITNIYNIMPDKDNSNIAVDPFLASDDFLMPAISSNAIYFANAMTVSAELVNPNLYIERFITNTADPMNASGLMTTAVTFVPVNINADVMAASAIFDNAGILISVLGPTMYASAIFKTENLNIKTTRIVSDDGFTSTITWYPDAIVTPWVAYLRATDVNAILPTREVI